MPNTAVTDTGRPQEKLRASPPALQALVDSRTWHHSIDFGDGVRSRGFSEVQLPAPDLVPFAGRSVLDVGAWDGYYSFLAEREGASRVVALDHYAWGVDIHARNAYWAWCSEQGRLPDHVLDTTDFWRPDLPGKGGFDLARRILGSNVESVVADFMATDLGELGTFDVVLFLGVLYHMKEPLAALQRVRSLTREVAVIETEALHLHGLDTASLLHFEAGAAVGADFGNWYIPTIEGLRHLCRAAGFSRVETVHGPPARRSARCGGRSWPPCGGSRPGRRPPRRRSTTGRWCGRTDEPGRPGPVVPATEAHRACA